MWGRFVTKLGPYTGEPAAPCRPVTGRGHGVCGCRFRLVKRKWTLVKRLRNRLDSVSGNTPRLHRRNTLASGLPG